MAAGGTAAGEDALCIDAQFARVLVQVGKRRRCVAECARHVGLGALPEPVFSGEAVVAFGRKIAALGMQRLRAIVEPAAAVEEQQGRGGGLVCLRPEYMQ